LLALNFHANLPKVLHIQELLHDLVYLLVIWGVSRSLELRLMVAVHSFNLIQISTQSNVSK
jgi:hypothetical protein